MAKRKKERTGAIVIEPKPTLETEPKVEGVPVVVASPPPPSQVQLDGLPMATKFIYEGREHRVGEKIEGYVVCYNLFSNEHVTLGSSTMVKPIK